MTGRYLWIVFWAGLIVCCPWHALAQPGQEIAEPDAGLAHESSPDEFPDERPAPGGRALIADDGPGAKQDPQSETARQVFENRWRGFVEAEGRLSQSLKRTLLEWKAAGLGQEQLRDAEKEELKTLRQVSAQLRDGRWAGARLRSAYQRIRDRRAGLAQPVVDDLFDSLDRFRAQQLEIHHVLLNLKKSWEKDFALAASELTSPQKSVFRVSASGLSLGYRDALLERRKLLAEVVSAGERIEDISLERRELLDQMEAVVLAQVFWIRDAAPIGPDVAGQAVDELGSVLVWLGDALGSLFAGELTRGINIASLVLYLILALLLIPGVMFAVQMRLREYAHKRWQPAVCRGQSIAQGALTLSLVALAAAPLAGYLVALGWWLSQSGWAYGIDLLVSQVLMHMGGILYLWLLARNLLDGDCLSVGMLDLRPETARALYRFCGWTLLGWLFFLQPASIMLAPPFEYVTLPRLAENSFAILLLLAFLPLLSRRSSLVGDLTGPGNSSIWWRSWGLIRAVIVLVLGASIALDLLGYRFGASHLAQGAVLSLLTIPILVGIYRLSMRALDHVARDRKREQTAAPGEEHPELVSGADVRLKRFLKTAFMLLGLGLLVFYWGVGSALSQALGDLTVLQYSTEGGGKAGVSVLDILAFLLTVVVTIWLARNLKGLFDVFLFPRLGMASGSRYALLTITRWTLVVVGMFTALSMVHMDLGKVGWLMAAMGVGIGFGLQEIIANMVSGVILLIERPIRVGDMLTVGGIQGKVRRINIRATTILNWDRQEVIVPNKDFITGQVINWTLADRLMRLVVTIGVAYGSDVDKVHDLLLKIAEEEPRVCKDPVPAAFFVGHGDSSLDFELFVYLADPEDRFEARDRLNTAINKGLAELGIEIPFPQRDLHVRSGKLPVELEKKG